MTTPRDPDDEPKTHNGPSPTVVTHRDQETLDVRSLLRRSFPCRRTPTTDLRSGYEPGGTLTGGVTDLGWSTHEDSSSGQPPTPTRTPALTQNRDRKE